MKLHICQTEWYGYRIKSLPPDTILPVIPEPGWPNGRRGLMMHRLWTQLRNSGLAGILWMDNDVAADPADLQAMSAAVAQLPDAMHTGWVKNWPASTSRPDWIWSHRGGVLGSPVPGQGLDLPAVYVSNAFLWTPRRLIELVWPQLPELRWQDIDMAWSEVALAHDIPSRTVAGCEPKHLHF